MEMQLIFIFCYLAILSIFDSREQKIPIVFICVGGVIILVMALYENVMNDGIGWIEILCGMIPGIVLLCVARTTKMVGIGDGMVFLGLGTYMGIRCTFMLLCVSTLLSAVLSILLLIGNKVKGGTRIPYLPFVFVAFCLQVLI